MSNLSEEEIINKLKERIRIDRSMRLNVESDFDRFCEEECQAIEGLIDLYNKEKETSHFLQSELDSANAKILEYGRQWRKYKKVKSCKV